MNTADYGRFYFKDSNGEWQFRKVNAKERIVLLQYYFRRRSGRMMKIENIAKAFRVSARTIQKDIKKLELQGIIKRIPVYLPNGFQKANKIVYTGDRSRLDGSEPSIDKIFAEDNPMKLRDFEWTAFWRYVDDQWLFFAELGQATQTDINSKKFRKFIDTNDDCEYYDDYDED